MSRFGERPALPSADPDDFEAPARVTPAHWLQLALGAARRRWLLAAAVLLASAALVVGYYRTRTPLYRVEAKILAQRAQTLTSLSRGQYDDQPTRSAWETVHRRENLVAIVRETMPLPGDAATGEAAAPARAPGGPTTPREDELVTILTRRLLVDIDAGTITISLDWPDAREAYAVVQAALRNFLEARHVQEITAFDEVISVLQARAATRRRALDDALEQARRRGPAPVHVVAPRVQTPSEELLRLQSLLEAKQRAIRDVEELRLRRVAELQAQVDQATTTLSDAHPTVIGLRKDLEAASRETPQVEALRAEERKVRKEYSDRMRREGFSGASPVPAAAPAPAVRATTEEDDPTVREARYQYEQVAARVNVAQVELDAARAAFKYRYDVIWPPQMPTEPVSPNPKKILGAGLLASLLLALGAAAAPDLWTGRIVQRWQVERALDVPIVGEIRRRG